MKKETTDIREKSVRDNWSVCDLFNDRGSVFQDRDGEDGDKMKDYHESWFTIILSQEINSLQKLRSW